jgi:hypothetical protein
VHTLECLNLSKCVFSEDAKHKLDQTHLEWQGLEPVKV